MAREKPLCEKSVLACFPYGALLPPSGQEKRGSLKRPDMLHDLQVGWSPFIKRFFIAITFQNKNLFH